MVAGGLKDAEAALEEVRGRLRRGERVAPTRLTFGEASEQWLSTRSDLRPATVEVYRWALDVHLLPRFSSMRLSHLTEDHVARLIADMRATGYTGWTIRAVLTPLRNVFTFAVRRGMVGSNPVSRLERGERPTVGVREMRILGRQEIEKLMAHADEEWRTLLATAIFTGLRLGELLGLTWADVDFDREVLRVRKQLNRKRERVVAKTPQAERDVVLMPALASMLAAHRLRSPFSGGSDFVFVSGAGGGIEHTAPRRALSRAMASAGLDGESQTKLRFHDLRHTFASLLIAQGQNVVFVSRQIGHAKPDVTLGVYAHLFDAEEHAAKASAALESSFGGMLSGNPLETSGGNGEQRNDPARAPNVASIR